MNLKDISTQSKTFHVPEISHHYYKQNQYVGKCFVKKSTNNINKILGLFQKIKKSTISKLIIQKRLDISAVSSHLVGALVKQFIGNEQYGGFESEFQYTQYVANPAAFDKINSAISIAPN